MKKLIFYLIVLVIFYVGCIVFLIILGITTLQQKYPDNTQLFSLLVSLFGIIVLTVAGGFLFKFIRDEFKELYKLDKENKKLDSKNKEMIKENQKLEEEGIRLEKEKEEAIIFLKKSIRIFTGN